MTVNYLSEQESLAPHALAPSLPDPRSCLLKHPPFLVPVITGFVVNWCDPLLTKSGSQKDLIGYGAGMVQASGVGGQCWGRKEGWEGQGAVCASAVEGC